MLLIIPGIPGSGKSTLAEVAEGTVCEADMYPGLYDKGGRRVGNIHRAHAWCQEKTHEAMERGDARVMVSNTFLVREHFCVYLEMAQEFGYCVKVIMPKYGLLHYPLDGVEDEKEQFAHVRRLRGPDMDRVIPKKIMSRMLRQFRQVRVKMARLALERDPAHIMALIENPYLGASLREIEPFSVCGFLRQERNYAGYFLRPEEWERMLLELEERGIDTSGFDRDNLPHATVLYGWKRLELLPALLERMPALEFTATHIATSADRGLVTVRLIPGCPCPEMEGRRVHFTVYCNRELYQPAESNDMLAVLGVEPDSG